MACSAPNSALRALDRQRLDLVDDLLALVVALARVALGVLVGEHRAGRLEHGRRDVVLRRDQAHRVALALVLGLRSARRSRDRRCADRGRGSAFPGSLTSPRLGCHRSGRRVTILAPAVVATPASEIERVVRPLPGRSPPRLRGQRAQKLPIAPPAAEPVDLAHVQMSRVVALRPVPELGPRADRWRAGTQREVAAGRTQQRQQRREPWADTSGLDALDHLPSQPGPLRQLALRQVGKAPGLAQPGTGRRGRIELLHLRQHRGVGGRDSWPRCGLWTPTSFRSACGRLSPVVLPEPAILPEPAAAGATTQPPVALPTRRWAALQVSRPGRDSRRASGRRRAGRPRLGRAAGPRPGGCSLEALPTRRWAALQVSRPGRDSRRASGPPPCGSTSARTRRWAPGPVAARSRRCPHEGGQRYRSAGPGATRAAHLGRRRAGRPRLGRTAGPPTRWLLARGAAHTKVGSATGQRMMGVASRATAGSSRAGGQAGRSGRAPTPRPRGRRPGAPR